MSNSARRRPASPPPRPSASRTAGRGRPGPSSHRRSPWLWVGIALVAAFVAAGVVAWATTGGSDTALTEPSVPGTPSEVQPVTVEGDALPRYQGGQGDPAVGRPAPRLSGYSFDGTPIVIDPAKGPALIVFVAHWCPHCNREVPVLVQWKASGRVPPDLQVIAVSTAVRPDADNFPPSEWLAGKGWDWPVMADGLEAGAASAMGLSAYPYFVLVGGDGLVKARGSGELSLADLDRLAAIRSRT